MYNQSSRLGKGFDAQRWKSLGSGLLLSVALSAFSLFGCGEKCRRRIGLSACLSEQMNKWACIVNEGREQKIGFGVRRWEERQRALSVPSTYRQCCQCLRCIHKFACFTFVSNSCVRVCVVDKFILVAFNMLLHVCAYVRVYVCAYMCVYVCVYTSAYIQLHVKRCGCACGIHHQPHPKCCLGNKLTEVNECPGSAEGLWESNMPAFRPISLTDSLFGL